MDNLGTRGLTFMHIRNSKQTVPGHTDAREVSDLHTPNMPISRVTEYSGYRQGVNNRNSTEL
ncbi:hypothetical protein ACN9ML_14920 [Dyadobacter endophyticus]|uniref:hypothetical protein n=1 Tax=Dyadobacter endophyticus TaxID=1749036 RepID=UPI003CEFDC71